MTRSKPPRPLTLYRRKDGMSYTYPSIRSASRDLGICYETLVQRAKDGYAIFVEGQPLHIRIEQHREVI